MKWWDQMDNMLYFQLPLQRITFFFFLIWGLCWGGEKQEVGEKYPPCIAQSWGGVSEMDRGLQWGQPRGRWREHSKFCSQSHPPASPLCSNPVCCNLVAQSLAVRNGGLSLHEAVLPASSVQFSSVTQSWPWYWMVCFGNEQRSFYCFWDCIQVQHFGLMLTMMATPFLLRDSCPQ